MRHFVYFSRNAVTSGAALSKRDLMQAGRMDIAIHSFIQGMFLSHSVREDAVFHFVFYGMPDPPKHIEIKLTDDSEVSKKDVAKLIKRILYKHKEGQKTEVMPGCFVEKKSLLKVIECLEEEGNEVYVLDKKGGDIREIKISKNCAFVLGDQDGLPKDELRRLKKKANLVSVGPKMYFASQVVAVVNNELDRRNI